VAQASDIINLPYANTLQPGAKVWVDNNGDGLWETVQKEEVFTQLTELAPVLNDVNQQYGSSVAQSRDKFSALAGSPRYRFPAGATLWNVANSYAEDSIVYIVDPYQTEFFQASQPVPQGIDIFNVTYWTPYSLTSLNQFCKCSNMSFSLNLTIDLSLTETLFLIICTEFTYVAASGKSDGSRLKTTVSSPHSIGSKTSGHLTSVFPSFKFFVK
jgi:hypothetical protein